MSVRIVRLGSPRSPGEGYRSEMNEPDASRTLDVHYVAPDD